MTFSHYYHTTATTPKLHSLALVLGSTAVVAVVGTISLIGWYPEYDQQEEKFVDDYVLGLTPISKMGHHYDYLKAPFSFGSVYWNRWKAIFWYPRRHQTARSITHHQEKKEDMGSVNPPPPTVTTKAKQPQQQQQQQQQVEGIKPIVSKILFSSSFTPIPYNGTFTDEEDDDDDYDDDDEEEEKADSSTLPNKDTSSTMDSTNKDMNTVTSTTSTKTRNDNLVDDLQIIKYASSMDDSSSLDATDLETMDESMSMDDTTTACTEEITNMNETTNTTATTNIPFRRRVFSTMVQYRYIYTPSSPSPSTTQPQTQPQQGF